MLKIVHIVDADVATEAECKVVPFYKASLATRVELEICFQISATTCQLHRTSLKLRLVREKIKLLYLRYE